MNEKSADFKVDIPATPIAKPARNRRKVYKSRFGAYYTSIHIWGQLAALVMGGLSVYYYVENVTDEHYAVGYLRMFTGLPDNVYLSQEEEQRKFIFAAIGCFILGSLLQLTVVWRAYFSPKFLAKNPSLSNFWPMAVSLVLRVASETIYQITETERSVTMSILWISLSLAYCILVVDGYWYDDDNPPKMAQGKDGYRLKPWYVEQLELPQ